MGREWLARGYALRWLGSGVGEVVRSNGCLLGEMLGRARGVGARERCWGLRGGVRGRVVVVREKKRQESGEGCGGGRIRWEGEKKHNSTGGRVALRAWDIYRWKWG